MPTRTEIVLHDGELQRAERHFFDWLRGQSWYNTTIGHDVIEDGCFNRIEYRVWIR
jgi:hypothetical protein